MYYDRSRRRTSLRRVLILLILVGAGVFLIINQNDVRQSIVPPPTPTATRTARSYVVEAESLAQTGDLKKAANAYIQAVSLEPENVDALVTLSRLLAYTDRTADAVKWAERAVQAVARQRTSASRPGYGAELALHQSSAAWSRGRSGENIAASVDGR